MIEQLRRFEILLPCQHNDGRRVPREVLTTTYQDLFLRFGGISIDTQTVRGVWLHEEMEYEDELVRVVIEVASTEGTIDFFSDFKEILMERFEQIEIWITSYLIDRI